MVFTGDEVGVGVVRALPSSDLVKIENLIRKRSPRTVPFSSDSASAVTRSYRSALPITTSTPTPSLVKTSLKEMIIVVILQFQETKNHRSLRIKSCFKTARRILRPVFTS